jgi:hypothetical protein
MPLDGEDGMSGLYLGVRGASQFLSREHTCRACCQCELLINTPLQRGGMPARTDLNRFSGFPAFSRQPQCLETAEAVRGSFARPITPLKRGLNEKRTTGVQKRGNSPH